ncbi:hypothetical protein CAPTEDRAFT_200341 [Capitella teleta]|uniref:Uncharacterized protein n=1 Tax=Capitella teleta TaxID=283909 RepID=R7UZU5_CAPTE|nr:hypothetical protein CAPTEDRAFT_200341 [Capitella teleta]|eukprot:ELU09472.1 hypothetical protein CAPTEDRAFT_200341 [Capitella teleta]
MQPAERCDLANIRDAQVLWIATICKNSPQGFNDMYGESILTIIPLFAVFTKEGYYRFFFSYMFYNVSEGLRTRHARGEPTNVFLRRRVNFSLFCRFRLFAIEHVDGEIKLPGLSSQCSSLHIIISRSTDNSIHVLRLHMSPGGELKGSCRTKAISWNRIWIANGRPLSGYKLSGSLDGSRRYFPEHDNNGDEVNIKFNMDAKDTQSLDDHRQIQVIRSQALNPR